ncbi:hypothetical protein KGQ20_08850 [Catenulispora sp. NF23]|uniref:Uncharacterized protein n=1 Tax=Catenulispora pinistramenti TaxID=2705254 RepID=A0ABS5KW39_9ACTN|nr:hypothetical protein [Catenulispora pinistramenti]MBS2532881.1 hypothetical protein [Catenulispora pinistramenti]MBS2550261.1 hypothetical protein [Catenulispora pinistramenti]
MPAASIPTTTIARAAQLVGFAVVAGALAVVSWRGTSLNLPNVGQFAGVIGSGFLGGIINPLMKRLSGPSSITTTTATAQMTQTAEASQVTQVTQTAEAVQNKAASALGQKTDAMWDIAVVIGAAAIVAAALALAINGQRHVNAAAALTALATAFGALFIDTSKVTHSLGSSAGS